MHDLTKSMDEIKKVKCTLLDWVRDEVGKGRHGVSCCDAEALDGVFDWIKDLAETEEKCMKAMYYKCLIEELHEEMGDEEGDRMGYNNRRYPSSGRYAAKGQGVSYGYRPNMMMHEEEDIEKYRLGQNPRMGYPMNGDWPHDTSAYDQYREAKKHYTETGNEAYKNEMDDRIKESVANTVDSFQEMWKDASPEVKKDMKTNLKSLVEKMERTP